MRISIIQIADNIYRSHQHAQRKIDHDMAHQYVNRLIDLSWRTQQPLNNLLPVLDCHCYQSTLHISFFAYSLKCQPDILYVGKPGILTRWFRHCEKKVINIKIPDRNSDPHTQYLIFLMEFR